MWHWTSRHTVSWRHLAQRARHWTSILHVGKQDKSFFFSFILFFFLCIKRKEERSRSLYSISPLFLRLLQELRLSIDKSKIDTPPHDAHIYPFATPVLLWKPAREFGKGGCIFLPAEEEGGLSVTDCVVGREIRSEVKKKKEEEVSSPSSLFDIIMLHQVPERETCAKKRRSRSIVPTPPCARASLPLHFFFQTKRCLLYEMQQLAKEIVMWVLGFDPPISS